MKQFVLRAALMCAVLAGLCGCAPQTQRPSASSEEAAAEARIQQKLVVERRIRDSGRLYKVAYPLLRNGVGLCRNDVGPTLGMDVATQNMFEGEYRGIARDEFAIANRPTVLAVAPGSPAELAGLHKGDVIEAVNGKVLPRGGGSRAALDKSIGEAGRKAVDLTVRRGRPDGAAEEDVEIMPVSACKYAIAVNDSSEVNAYADGRRIIFTRGVMDFARTDTELAVVVSHEIAHNAMGHNDARETNTAIGGGIGLVVDVLAAVAGVNTAGSFTKLGVKAGAGAYSQAFEAEADYVGLYLMARAGDDYRHAPNIWRRMGAARPEEITFASTHPTTAARFVAMTKAAREIETKIAAGEPLDPEKVPETDAVASTRSAGGDPVMGMR